MKQAGLIRLLNVDPGGTVEVKVRGERQRLLQTPRDFIVPCLESTPFTFSAMKSMC